jgi:hypothetical protein
MSNATDEIRWKLMNACREGFCGDCVAETITMRPIKRDENGEWTVRTLCSCDCHRVDICECCGNPSGSCDCLGPQQES